MGLSSSMLYVQGFGDSGSLSREGKEKVKEGIG